MEFKKQLFIFSYSRIKNIESILKEVSYQEIELKPYGNNFPNNQVLSNLTFLNSKFFHLEVTQDKFEYVYIICEYNPHIMNLIKLLRFKGSAIEIASSSHANYLIDLCYELDQILDLHYYVYLAWEHAGFSITYKSKKISSYIDSCEQHLIDARSDLTVIAEELFKNYKRIYLVYSALQVEDHHR